MSTAGLIGAGYWGFNYLRVFDEMSACDLKWCADLDDERLSQVAEQYPSIQTTTDYEDICIDPAVDFVCIATPPSSHFKLAKRMLRQGKDIIVEKPFTLDSSEAWTLAEMAEDLDRIVLVGHIYEYHQVLDNLHGRVKGGELGNLYYLHSQRTGLGPVRSDVSALWDLCPHDISIFDYLVDGKIEAVRCLGHRFLLDVEDSIFLFLEFDSGVEGFVHASWLHPNKTREVTLVGDEKMAIFNDADPNNILQIYDNTVEVQKPQGLKEFHLKIREGNISLPHIDYVEPLKFQVEHFLDCVQTRRTPLTGPEEGATMVEVLEAAEHSINQGGARVAF
jgi:predicted dehydrogenase